MKGKLFSKYISSQGVSKRLVGAFHSDFSHHFKFCPLLWTLWSPKIYHKHPCPVKAQCKFFTGICHCMFIVLPLQFWGSLILLYIAVSQLPLCLYRFFAYLTNLVRANLVIRIVLTIQILTWNRLVFTKSVRCPTQRLLLIFFTNFILSFWFLGGKIRSILRLEMMTAPLRYT